MVDEAGDGEPAAGQDRVGAGLGHHSRGYRSGDNPARWLGRLDHLLPARNKVREIKHHAALPYADLPAFMAELHGRKETPPAPSNS